MFCGQCGKRVLETMLFCPFCGSPIVIPDQDDDAVSLAAPEAPAEEPQALFEPETEAEPAMESEPEPEAEEESEPEEEFAPLWFDEPEAKGDPEPEPAPVEPEPASARPLSLFDTFPEEEEFTPLQPVVPEVEIPEPVRTPDLPREPEAPEAPVPPKAPPARRRPAGAARRSNQTLIPVKDVDLDDMFMDSSHPDAGDAYDPYDDDGGDAVRHDFDFEEPEHGDFLQRHIRGIVGLALLALLLIIFVFWAIMPKGQQVLAAANIAWRAQPYGELGYTAFNAGQHHQAAVYFERALAREPDNYEYAHSAMVAYYEADEIESALAMLKKCIEMNPDSSEPYYELMLIYPNADNRPWEVQELLRLGYERTGDASLKVTSNE